MTNQSSSKLQAILNHLQSCSVLRNGIYITNNLSSTQQNEKSVRDQLATVPLMTENEILKFVAEHHSFEVMQYELKKFIQKIPTGGVLIDVGTGFGWHWVELSKHRPDLVLFLVDFSYASLLLAKRLLNDKCVNQTFFICGDAMDLPFEEGSVDAYWSVQTLQHVPSWQRAISEAHRILKKDSMFANYSLNNQKIVEWMYKKIKRNYIVDGEYIPGINLVRANNEQRKIIERCFGTPVEVRYSEVLYSPELLITRPGKRGSIIGKLDRYMSGSSIIARSIGRQSSFHAKKVS
jgi:ubiquinone/menaquinone biosynthesis C-methylase UbiE